jgi:hypothetical protein
MADVLDEFALQHIEFPYLVLLDDLHRILLPGFLFFGKDNASESALTEVLPALIALWTSCVLFPFG